MELNVRYHNIAVIRRNRGTYWSKLLVEISAPWGAMRPAGLATLRRCPLQLGCC